MALDPDPELPREAFYIWNMWIELNNGRGSSGFGPNPISWADLDSYCRVTGTDLESWEARAIRSIDDAYMVSASESLKSGGG